MPTPGLHAPTHPARWETARNGPGRPAARRTPATAQSSPAAARGGPWAARHHPPRRAGTASGSTGPTRGPEASPAPATATRTGLGLQHRVFRVGKNATANAALTSDTWRLTAAQLGQDSSVTASGDHAL